MKKLVSLIVGFVILLITGFIVPENVQVQAADNCSTWGTRVTISPNPVRSYIDTSVSIQVEGLSSDTQYTLLTEGGYGMKTQQTNFAGVVTFTLTGNSIINAGIRQLVLMTGTGTFPTCELGSFEVLAGAPSCNLQLSYSPAYTPMCVDSGTILIASATEVKQNGIEFTGDAEWSIYRPGSNPPSKRVKISSGSTNFETKFFGSDLSQAGQTFQVKLDVNLGAGGNIICESNNISVYISCANRPTGGAGGGSSFDPTCGINKSGIDTALGCLPTDPEVFVGLVLPWAAGIGGGVAFLLMLYGVFMIIISSGVPDKMQAGKELISSAITGLLIIIFAVFILRFIGVDVLGLFS